jgi:Di-haem cytochrome c peroxidase
MNFAAASHWTFCPRFAMRRVMKVLRDGALGDRRRATRGDLALLIRRQTRLSRARLPVDLSPLVLRAAGGCRLCLLAQRTFLLGKLLMFDKQLSVNRNEACAFCHMPETGFTGPISELNATTVAYPGSVRTRFSQRKPQSHSIRLQGIDA